MDKVNIKQALYIEDRRQKKNKAMKIMSWVIMNLQNNTKKCS